MPQMKYLLVALKEMNFSKITQRKNSCLLSNLAISLKQIADVKRTTQCEKCYYTTDIVFVG